MHQIGRTHPHLVATRSDSIDAIRSARFPADEKLVILDRVWCEAGPEALLSIGKGVRTVGYDPVWDVAVNSASPKIFFDKWRRFEVFAHWKNRVRIRFLAETRAAFQRYAVGGGDPTPAENLMICGLSIALLEEIGCCGLSCKMPLVDGSMCCIYRQSRICVPAQPDVLATAAWEIEWREIVPRAEPPGTEAAVAQVLTALSYDARLRATLRAVIRLVTQDVARQWRVGELAREAGMSKRSLQRRLQNAGLSFSQLVRLVRVQEACRLLGRGDMPITAIGFCAGFSDSSHFSRDFNASMGMTPSEYRAVCQSR